MDGKHCGCGKGCATFGACLRGKNIRLGDLTGVSGPWEKNLDAYASARRQGMSPASCERVDVEKAKVRSGA